MTKKDYCLQNKAVASHQYYNMYLHGFEYGIDDYAYITRFYQKTVCGEKCVSFHKVKIYTDIDGDMYVNIIEKYFNGKKHSIRLYLHDFLRFNFNISETVHDEILKAIA